MKSLETDASYKIDAELDKHRDRDDFPVIYGASTTDKLLAHLPDGDSEQRGDVGGGVGLHEKRISERTKKDLLRKE